MAVCLPISSSRSPLHVPAGSSSFDFHSSSTGHKIVERANFSSSNTSAGTRANSSRQVSHRYVVVQCSSLSGVGPEGSEQTVTPGTEMMEQPQSNTTCAQASLYQPASLSRVFIGVQPGRGVARLTKVGKPSGPMSLVLLLFTVAGTISAAVRSRLESAARECTTCHGYGINRCTLCSGTGAVGWEGKWDHKEPCPMCLGKRFVDCPECGGHFHRRMFNHHHHSGLTVTEVVEAEQGTLAKMGD